MRLKELKVLKTILALGTNVVLLLLPLKVRCVASASPTVTTRALVTLSSLIVWLATSLMVGAVFVTVIVKVCTLVETPPLAVPPVSIAVTVTVAVPAAVPGSKLKVRLASMAGCISNSALLLFVTVKLTVWEDSSVGPAEMLEANADDWKVLEPAPTLML